MRIGTVRSGLVEAVHDVTVVAFDPSGSVAAVSGLCGVKDGLEGVIRQGYPGKVVIYPQILEFPVTALPDLKDTLPAVYAQLGANESWTVEAETEFLRGLIV